MIHLVLKFAYSTQKCIWYSKVNLILKSKSSTGYWIVPNKQWMQVDLSLMYSQKQVSTPKSSRARRCQSEDRSVVIFPSSIFVSSWYLIIFVCQSEETSVVSFVWYSFRIFENICQVVGIFEYLNYFLNIWKYLPGGWDRMARDGRQIEYNREQVVLLSSC